MAPRFEEMKMHTFLTGPTKVYVTLDNEQDIIYTAIALITIVAYIAFKLGR